MLAAHAILAIAAVAVALAAGVWGSVAYRTGPGGGRVLTNLLEHAQSLLIAQVALGLLLLSGKRRATDDLHYAYGTLALAAVLAPWLYAPSEGRRRLLWFAGATVVAAALGVRATMTGS